MNGRSIFSLYNIKNLKKEKLILLFTMLSILITTTLSMVVPILSENMQSYNEKSFKEANSGDLYIKKFFDSKVFDAEIDKIIGEGYKVSYKNTTSAFYLNKNGGKLYAMLIKGETDIKKNEIIISSSLAKNLSVKVGDKIDIKVTDGIKTYSVKEIEGIPKGLTNDENILGYGKVNDAVTNGNLIYIKGNTDGEALKKRLKEKEDSFFYSSIKDKKQELESNTSVQLASFGALTTMGYILSSVVIITTSIMLIIRRKRDISIMKLLSLKNKYIKNAMRLEMSLIIVFPILISIATAIFISNIILKANFIPICISTGKTAAILLKGVAMNVVFFQVFSNLPLLIINDFKGMWLLRVNEEKSSLIKKRIFIYLILLIPVMLILYSVYIGSAVNIATSIGIILVILIFLIFASILIKLFSSIRYKNKLFMYCFKNLKNNFLTFILIIVSFSITLVFLMITLNLNSTVKDSMNKTIKDALPYNYITSSRNGMDIEKQLTKENGVAGYNKYYGSVGKVLNENIKFKALSLYEVKEGDFKLAVNEVEGQKLFQGEDGCLITTKYKSNNNIKLGDVLQVSLEDKIIDIKVIGVYDNSIFDTNSIILPYKGYGKTPQYYVKSTSTKWMSKIGDNPVMSVDTLGNSLSAFINKFTNIFQSLSLMIVFASLIFNINLLNITFFEERREETIIRALGLGKAFIAKVYFFKGIVTSLIACLLSYGFYVLVSKLLLKLMGISARYSISGIVVLIICSLSLTAATFIYPFIKMRKADSYEFLRES